MSRITFLPLLLLGALVGNILLPIHSQYYFFTLSVGQLLVEGKNTVSQNMFTQLGYKNLWASISPFFDALVYLLEKNLGDLGPALFQCFLFFAFAVLVFVLAITVSSKSTLGEKHKNEGGVRVSYLSMICMLVVGAALYGVGLHSIVFFALALLLFSYGMVWGYEEKSFVLYALLGFVVILLPFDIRILFVPFFFSLIAFFSNIKINNLKFLFSSSLVLFFTVLAIPFLRDALFSYFEALYNEMQLAGVLYYGILKLDFSTLGSYAGFSFGFYFLVHVLFLVRSSGEGKAGIARSFFIFFFSLFAFIVSPALKMVSLFICLIGLSKPHTLNMHRTEQSVILKIEETIFRMAGLFSKLSYSGRVFVVSAYIFVQIVSFFKYPVTDLLMPAREVDSAILQDRCPKELDPYRYGGYLVYRFQHKKECLPEISLFTLGALELVEINLIKDRSE